jgi:hypothetical protein
MDSGKIISRKLTREQIRDEAENEKKHLMEFSQIK